MTRPLALRPLSDSAFVWRCPTCGRPSPKCYRCVNHDCGADLAGDALEVIRS